MIYVSSACIQARTIHEAVASLADAGFPNIELTGGTEPYDGLEQDLVELARTRGIRYLCHNYFPPERDVFVLNLASLNDTIYERSLAHYSRAIDLSKRLGADSYGIHAGFRVDIPAGEIGRSITPSPLADRDAALARFCDGVRLLQRHAGEAVRLFIENNVLSARNFQAFGDRNPLLLTSSGDYHELAAILDFHLLLDVAHLKVSCGTLGLDFAAEMNDLCGRSAYIHLSHNDGIEDSNNGFLQESDTWRLTRDCGLSGKIITLEIYNDLAALKQAYTLISAHLTQASADQRT